MVGHPDGAHARRRKIHDEGQPSPPAPTTITLGRSGRCCPAPPTSFSTSVSVALGLLVGKVRSCRPLPGGAAQPPRYANGE